MTPPAEGLRSTRTNALGNFEISDLEAYDSSKRFPVPGKPGEFHIFPWKYLFVQHPHFGRTSAKFYNAPGTVNVTLQRPAAIEGRVINGEIQEPVAGAVVDCRGVTSPASSRVVTDSQGRYRMGSLGANRYNIWAEKEGWTVRAIAGMEVAAGETKIAPDLRLIRGVVAVGQVIDVDTGGPIRPLEDERLAREFDPPEVLLFHGPSRPRGGAAAERAEVERDGGFRIRVAPGMNRLYLRMPQSWSVISPPSGDVEQEIADGAKAEIQFRVQRKPNGPR